MADLRKLKQEALERGGQRELAESGHLLRESGAAPIPRTHLAAQARRVPAQAGRRRRSHQGLQPRRRRLRQPRRPAQGRRRLQNHPRHRSQAHAHAGDARVPLCRAGWCHRRREPLPPAAPCRRRRPGRRRDAGDGSPARRWPPRLRPRRCAPPRCRRPLSERRHRPARNRQLTAGAARARAPAAPPPPPLSRCASRR